MKILQVNCVYNQGSTGKITYELHKGATTFGFQSVVCYGRGALSNERHLYKICSEFYAKMNNVLSRITGIMYGGCFFSTNKLISIIKRETPDIVHLHCINGHFVNVYRLVNWLKMHHVKTVLTLHAEFMYTGGCSHAIDCNQWHNHNGCGCTACPRWRIETKSLFFNRTGAMWKKMYAAFKGFENLKIVAVSPWLMERAKGSVILGDFEHCVILNGLNTSIFHKYNTTEMQTEFGDKKIIFHVTPFFSLDENHIKGGRYVCEVAKRMPDVQFLVAGSFEENIEVPKNIKLLGKISNQEMLAKYYSLADLTLLTSKKETFSMVTAESLCCGTPVIGFKAGAPEQITIKEYSDFVEYGDIEMLIEKVKQRLALEKTDDIAQVAIQKYSKENMSQNYLKIYRGFK